VVLGGGTDVPYPARHAGLFRQILARGGALVSLVPSAAPPRREWFPRRNPLIAALSDLVIVVEADVRSGSLSTAQAGTRLGRPIAAWPGSPGCDRLIAGGAAVVESEADALAALAGTPRRPPPVALDPIAARVADAIAAGASDVDAVAQVTGLPVRDVLAALPQVEDSLSARKQ
jgi:DNA processing protein